MAKSILNNNLKTAFKWTVGLFMVVFMANFANAQYSLSGPSSVITGQDYTYTVSGPNINELTWANNNGTAYGVNATDAVCNFTNVTPTLVTCQVRDFYFNTYNLKKGVSVCNPLNSGSISGTQTICYGGDPSTLGNAASATGGNGTFSYQWQYYDGGWVNIGSATSATYNPPSGLTSTRQYRRRVTSCNQTDESNTITVTVRSQLSAGTLSGPPTSCYGSDPGMINVVTSSGGGDGNYSYQWEKSDNGIDGWQDINGATSATYDLPGNATASKWYRKKVTSCGQIDYTDAVWVKILNSLSKGSISGAQTICYGGDATTIQNGSLPTGGSASSYTYQWEYSNNGTSGWTIISGATATTYDPPSGLIADRWYRRREQSCGQTVYTDGVKVTVMAEITIPALPSITNNCGNTVLTRTTPPSGITWYWQTSSSGTSTSNSNTTVTLTSGTNYYLRGRNSIGCWGPARTISYTVNQPVNWYADTDGDGFGDFSSSLSDCDQPTGYVGNNLDFNDTNAMITDVAPQTFYSDKDGDGFGESTPTIYASYQPLGYADNSLDQCPEVPGSVNGCNYQPPVFSDENYVFSRTYQSEMSESTEIKVNSDVLENIVYYDGLGRPKQQIAIKGSKVESNSISPNYPAGWTMDWTEGANATPFFNRNGDAAENNIITGPDPFGKSALIWSCGNDPASNADGGWNTDYITVDKTKTYRYTVWVRRDFSQDGTTYLGTQNVDNLSGGANSNPYFWNGDLPQLGEWYLLVGIVHPYGHAAGDSGVSGVYDMQGNKVLDGTEFKWGSTTTTSRFRSYLYYATNGNVRQYFYQPILEIVDGSEVPLGDMFAGEGAKDVISHVGYDSFGRQDKEWLPYMATSGNLGSFRSTAEADTDAYYVANYGSEMGVVPNPFWQKELEASPLSRVLKQAAPGEDWQLGNGHEIEFEYRANDTLEVRRFSVSTNFINGIYEPILVDSSGTTYYNPGELYQNITKDENHDGTASKLHTTEEFTDKHGRVVLKRTYAMISGAETAHDTYYVYDDYGNLSYVLPPLVDTADGVSVPELSELCYQYKYDHRNRLVEKKIPGKGWEYIVYNTLDQPVMTQDAVQRPNKQWLFTKYDALGRVAYTGLHTQANVISRETMQGYADNTTAYDQYESKQGSSTSLAGTTIYYSNNAIPQTITEIHTINYYDTYADTDGLAVPATVLGQATTTSTQGLATVSKIRVLGTSDWITTITGYDVKGRAIYSASKNNYLNTTDIVETKLDFVGKVLETKTTHQRTGYSDIVTVDTFTYDDLGRLLTQKQTITGQPEENLVNNGYDELGHLTTKQVGGGLQTVDYTYNVRGWLKAINDPNALGNDLFAFGINYNTQDHGGATLFNGNIAETEWKTANDNTLRWYRYGYDPLNRITSATANSANYNLSGVTYDKNGNIKTLTRMGHTNSGATTFGTMDNLIYTYDSGNKLLKVLDNGNDDYGFKDGVDQTTEYTYDANGNLVTDVNKGVTDFEYNHLNLPTTIVTGFGTISYVYDAVGTKLKKTVSAGGSVTEYAGGFIYQDNALQFFGQPEGYVTPNGMGGYDYVYQYKDHLGNIRLSYVDNGGALEIVEENNYYPFGLKHKGYNEVVSSYGNSVAQKWKFGGKEYEDGLNGSIATYDFGARNYDPALGRWMNLDPLAEQMRRHSPYNYAFDNPVFFIDPDGMAPYDCCPPPGGSIPTYGFRIGVFLYSLASAIADLPPMPIEGDATDDWVSGDKKHTSEEDKVTIVVSDSRGDNNDTTDAPTEFIDGDALGTAAKSIRGAASNMKFPTKNGPPNSGPSKKSIARSVMENGKKAKNGMEKGSKAAGTVSAENQIDQDTTLNITTVEVIGSGINNMNNPYVYTQETTRDTSVTKGQESNVNKFVNKKNLQTQKRVDEILTKGN